jgi:hypothetical protein
MGKSLVLSALLLSGLLYGCNGDELAESINDSLTASMDGLTESIESQGVEAAEPPRLGFTPDLPYPKRNHTYDGYMPPVEGLSQADLDRFTAYYAFPQSHEAMVGLLGYPYAEDGNVKYWKISGGSSELAVTYSNDEYAQSYTFGAF